MAPSLNLLPDLYRAGLVVQTAPVSFRRRFFLLIYTFLSHLPIFYQYNLFLNFESYFVAPKISFRAYPGPDIIDESALFTSPA